MKSSVHMDFQHNFWDLRDDSVVKSMCCPLVKASFRDSVPSPHMVAPNHLELSF